MSNDLTQPTRRSDGTAIIYGFADPPDDDVGNSGNSGSGGYQLFCLSCRCRLKGFVGPPHNETCGSCGRVFPDDDIKMLFSRRLFPPDWQFGREVLNGETMSVAYPPSDAPGCLKELLVVWRD